jgi:hypothetical protein
MNPDTIEGTLSLLIDLYKRLIEATELLDRHVQKMPATYSPHYEVILVGRQGNVRNLKVRAFHVQLHLDHLRRG